MNTPTSAGLSGGAAAVASTPLSKAAHELTVFNRSASTDEVFFTIDGTTPTVGGANQYYLPVGGQVQVFVRQDSPGEFPAETTLNLQAISAAAWSIWVQMEQ